MNHNHIIVGSTHITEPSQFFRPDDLGSEELSSHPKTLTVSEPIQLCQVSLSFVQTLQHYLINKDFIGFLSCFGKQSVLHKYYPLAGKIVTAFREAPRNHDLSSSQEADLPEQEWLQLYFDSVFASYFADMLQLAAFWENYMRTVACKKAIARLQPYDMSLKLLVLYGNDPTIDQWVPINAKQALIQYRQLFYQYFSHRLLVGNEIEKQEHFILWLASSSSGDQRPYYTKLVENIVEFLEDKNYAGEIIGYALNYLEKKLNRLKGDNTRFLCACYHKGSDQYIWLEQHNEHQKIFSELTICMHQVVGEAHWQHFTQKGTWLISHDQILMLAMLSGQVDNCSKLFSRISKLSEQYRQEYILERLIAYREIIGQLTDVLLSHSQQHAWVQCFPQFSDHSIRIPGELHKAIGQLQLFIQDLQLPKHNDIWDAWRLLLETGNMTLLTHLLRTKQKFCLLTQGQISDDKAGEKDISLAKVLARFLLPLKKYLQVAQDLTVNNAATLLTTVELDRSCFSARKSGKATSDRLLQSPPSFPPMIIQDHEQEHSAISVETKILEQQQLTPKRAPKIVTAQTTGGYAGKRKLEATYLTTRWGKKAKRRLFIDNADSEISTSPSIPQQECKLEEKLPQTPILEVREELVTIPQAPVDCKSELLTKHPVLIEQAQPLSESVDMEALSIPTITPNLSHTDSLPPLTSVIGSKEAKQKESGRLPIAESKNNLVQSDQDNKLVAKNHTALTRSRSYSSSELDRARIVARQSTAIVAAPQRRHSLSPLIRGSSSALFNHQVNLPAPPSPIAHQEASNLENWLLVGVLIIVGVGCTATGVLAVLGIVSLVLALSLIPPVAISAAAVSISHNNHSTPKPTVPISEPTLLSSDVNSSFNVYR